MDGPKEFVARFTREKFPVGTEGISRLAPELHQAIQQLSVELYQNDFHFIKEVIQNAEDNTYGEDVCPSLEFQLVKEDVVKVGRSTTLLILNNELGLTTADAKALCSVGRSTKAGRRDKGYIGCKGTFKFGILHGCMKSREQRAPMNMGGGVDLSHNVHRRDFHGITP